MKSSEIRQKFLDFFASKAHTIVPSSSLIPSNDATLLFTNAGMVQFKDVFLGQDTRPYVRATSSQRCVRAGGKHNDLENVGYTARHHTFFEMLGNFSFGDYFKRDAILFAWEFLTSPNWLNLPTDKLYVTVYASDDEAYDLWHKEVGLAAERIIRIGDNKGALYASDNFWQMGDTGPCGPCTEIFYDHGEHIWGGLPGTPDEDGDRFIEIWNNVFMQFNRDESGTLHPLPKPSVDTGMGLERISAVLQHVNSNYDIDLFQHLIKAAADATGCTDLAHNSLKVIADHIRACSFLVIDGVIPANDGRGYVLRRIIRRAIRHGYKLGQKQAFFYQLVEALTEVMGDAYPELHAQQTRIASVLKQEEDRFAETLEHGMAILDTSLANGDLDGETAFKLYDTYGFPVDMTADICRERTVTLDMAGFDAAMARQRAQSKAGSKFKAGGTLDYTGASTQFHGYQDLQVQAASVLALYKDGSPVSTLHAGEDGVVVLDKTPFYAESGGQAGDRGTLHHENTTFTVEDTLKIQASVFGHHGRVNTGTLQLGQTLTATVDAEARRTTANNHSATHLLHAALRQVLGTHVTQKGSLVDAERTRFDFAHGEPISTAQCHAIEALVNRQIRANHRVEVAEMSFDDAVASGAMALFGEKYGDSVRVLRMGDFSVELCGGTHVQRTGDIGLFKITSEGGVAAGVRRIEAITGEAALALTQAQQTLLAQLGAELKAQPSEIMSKLTQTLADSKALDKEVAKLKTKLAANQGDALLSQAVEVGGVKILAAVLEGADNAVLRDSLDKLKDKLKTAVIVLGSVQGDKVSLIAGVTTDCITKVKAGELVNFVAQQVGGKGGGRPDMAQAGGTEPEKLADALASVTAWLGAKLL